ncbi:MAG: polymorphic toxin-type HINT domain-containing protein [Gallionella sp.]
MAKKEDASGFVAGTPVWTERGLVPIEQIKVGDRVLSKCDSTGEVAYKPVVRTFVTEDQEIIFARMTGLNNMVEGKEVEIEDYFFMTANHPVWAVNKGWVSVIEAGESWEERTLARRNEEECFIGDAFPAFQVPSEPNVGVVTFNHSEEFCFLVEFDGTSNYLPNNYLSQRFNGGTPRYFDNDKLVSDFYIDEPEPADRYPFRTTVYNIEVEDFHTYFVGELGLWVHSACQNNSTSPEVDLV